MKRIYSLLLILTGLGLAISNASAQTANITAGCAPVEISFTGPTGASGYFWDFKDGATSTQQNPKRIFSQPGVYNVEFRNRAGGPVVATIPVTIYAKPVVDVEADPASGCAPLNVTLKDASTVANGITVTGYQWVFGDGSGTTGAATASHVYQNAGAYTVSLRLTTNLPSCNVDATQIFEDLIQVSDMKADFVTDPNPATACEAPLTVNFDITTQGGSGDITYDWDFGNGEVFTGEAPPAQLYAGNGLYPVQMTATDALQCTQTITRNVSVGPPVANFELPDTICAGAPVVIRNLSATGTYRWNFGGGAQPATSSAANPSVTYSTPGEKQITLVVTSADGRCTGDTTIVVYVDQVDASFSMTPDYSCTSPTTINVQANATTGTAYDWTFGDGSEASGPAATYNWSNPLTNPFARNGERMDTIQLIVSGISQCRDTGIQVVTFQIPNAQFTPDKTKGCAPLTVNMTNLSTSRENIQSYTYLLGNGTTRTFNNAGPHAITFDQPGDYEVQLVVANSGGCTDTSYVVLIEVGAPVTPDFTADKTTVCPGDTIQFSDLSNNPNIDAWHYNADSNRLWHCFDDPNPSWAPVGNAGSIDVTLTVGYNGCFSTLTKEDFIKVNGPVAEIAYEITCDSQSVVQFRNKSREASLVTWDFGDESPVANTDNPKHTYAEPGDYWVKLTAEGSAGCAPSVDSVLIPIRMLESKFELEPFYCLGVEYDLDATMSTGVNATCWKGYTWFFSDNRPITTQDSIIKYQFQDTGKVEIKLVVESIIGCLDTLVDSSIVKTVYPEFALDKDTICLPMTVRFTDMSTASMGAIEKWEWDFGDMQMGEGQNTTHTYAPGSVQSNPLTVMLSVEDENGCPGSLSKDIYVYTPESQIITDPGQPVRICSGEDVAFSATDFTNFGSSLRWEWRFGDGANGAGQNVTHTYNNGGRFNVELLFTEIATGCRGTTNTIVEVQNYPDARFTTNVDGQAVVCHPANVFFTDVSTSNVQLTRFWDFGNGQFGAGGSPATNYPKGTFRASLFVTTSAGCSDTTSRSFTFVGPDGDFTISDDQICPGQEVSFTAVDLDEVSNFTWDFGDGTTANQGSPVSHQYNTAPPSGALIAKLLLAGQSGCNFTVEKTITFTETIADFQDDDLNICTGLGFPFINTSVNADTYQWTFGDNTQASTQVNPSHIYGQTGSYTVRLIASSGNGLCRDTVQKTINVYSLPELQVADISVCFGSTGTLRVQNPPAGLTYIWSPSVLDPGQPVTEVFPSETTVYTVTGIDARGCSTAGDATVTVSSGLPNAPAQNFVDSVYFEGASTIYPITFNDNFVFKYTLPAGVTISCEQCSNPVITIGSQTAQITLEVTTKDGQCPQTFNITVVLAPNPVQIPNVFSPNNDGTNDFFKLVVADKDLATQINIQTFKVFNRWGQVVYDNDNGLQGWNGKVNGTDAPSDVYAYLVEFNITNGDTQTFKGDVTLIR